MNALWQEFLMTAGAKFQDGIITHFGNPEQERAVVVNGNVIADLSHEGLIGVEGTDALAFLQGQMTCDLREVNPEVSRIGAWCNHQGRVRIIFRVFQWHTGFYLELPAECVDDTLKQLRKYIFRSKVVLRDASAERIRLGCSGPTIADDLRKIFFNLPAHPDQIIQTDTATIIRLRGSWPRFEILGEHDALIKIWNSLKVRAVAIAADAWSILEILSGVPKIMRATAEAWVPHMLNLPEIGAVNFHKGCYSGQEVVARTQYLGKSKRRLYLAHIPGGELPKPGDPLWTSTEGAQEPGQIVNCTPSPEGGFLVLAVISIAAVREQEIRLRDSHGLLLKFIQLPYSFLEE